MRRRDYYWSLFDESEKKQIDNLRTEQVEAVFAALPERLVGTWWIWRDGFENWKPYADFPQLLVSLRKVEDQTGIQLPPPPPLTMMETAPVDDDESYSMTAEITGTKIHSVPSGAASIGTTSSTADRKTGKKNLPPVAAAAPKAKEQSQEKFKSGEGSGSFDFSKEATSPLVIDPGGSAEDRNNHRFHKNFDVRIIAGDRVFTNKTVDVSMKGMQLQDPLPLDLPRYFNVEIRRKGQAIPVVCSEVKNRDGSKSFRVKIEINDFSSGLLALLLAG